MKKSIKIIFILFLILFTFCSCNAGTDEDNASLDFFLMDTYMSLSVTASNADSVISESYQKISEIEKAISRTDENSDVYKLNNSHGEIIKVSDITYDILSIAIDCAIKTQGIFDPTISSITELWDIGSAEASVPPDHEIKNALSSVSYNNIILHADNNVQLLNGAQIDLGAMGKGYAADKVVEIYKKHNATQGIITLSGNIYFYGEKEDGTLWNVGIKDPDNIKEVNISLETKATSIVTSGAYERFFEQDEIIYHHIFDTSTGYPTQQDLKSVSVICESSVLADIYSTALFAMGFDAAIEFSKNENINVILIRENNELYVSEKIAESVNIGEKYEN